MDGGTNDDMPETSGGQVYLPRFMRFGFADQEAESLYREYYTNEKRADFKTTIVIILIVNLVLIVIYSIKFTEDKIPQLCVLIVTLLVTLVVFGLSIISTTDTYTSSSTKTSSSSSSFTGSRRHSRNNNRHQKSTSIKLKASASSSTITSVNIVANNEAPNSTTNATTTMASNAAHSSHQPGQQSHNARRRSSLRPTLLSGSLLAVIPLIVWLVQLSHVFCDLWLFSALPRLPPDAVSWVMIYTYSIYIFFPLRLRYCGALAALMALIHLLFVSISPKTTYYFKNQLAANLLLFIGTNLLGTMSYFFYEKQQRRAFLETRQSLEVKLVLEEESREQERLLLSVLPKHVAAEIRQDLGAVVTGQFKKIYMSRHENVSILFADIVGFTAISSTCPAPELVKTLNELFARFDKLADKYHQLRIKILGDCYYCISGAPEERPDHAVLCVHMGLSMVEAIKTVREQTKSTVDMRVGIHTGGVLAGVLGQRQWQFDVYSRDVELANKMESSGLPGRVHVSEKTVSCLNGEFELVNADAATREEAIRLSGIKTYLIVKVLKPYPEGTLDALKPSQQQSHSVPVNGGGGDVKSGEQDGGAQDGQGAGDKRDSEPNETTPIINPEGNIKNIEYKRRLRQELLTRDTERNVREHVNPITLNFRDQNHEIQYRCSKDITACISIISLPFTLLCCLITYILIGPTRPATYAVMSLGFLVLAAKAFMCIAPLMSNALPKPISSVSIAMQQTQWIRLVIVGSMLAVWISAHIVANVLCDAERNEIVSSSSSLRRSPSASALSSQPSISPPSSLTAAAAAVSAWSPSSSSFTPKSASLVVESPSSASLSSASSSSPLSSSETSSSISRRNTFQYFYAPTANVHRNRNRHNFESGNNQVIGEFGRPVIGEGNGNADDEDGGAIGYNHPLPSLPRAIIDGPGTGGGSGGGRVARSSPSSPPPPLELLIPEAAHLTARPNTNECQLPHYLVYFCILGMLGITAVTRIGYLLKMFIIVTLVIVQTSINLISLKQSFNAYDTLTYQSELVKSAQQESIDHNNANNVNGGPVDHIDITRRTAGGSLSPSGGSPTGSGGTFTVTSGNDDDDDQDVDIPINEDQLERTVQMNAFFGHEYTLTLVIVTITIALFLINRQFELMSRRLFLWKKEIEEQKEKVADMRRKNEALVYNILPPHVAKHFLGKRKNDEELYSKSYDAVGVLFAAMPNFSDFYTEESVNNQGLECLRFLNEVISDYDALLERQEFRDIIKIKTIGATYMAASGLTGVDADSPVVEVSSLKRYAIDSQLIANSHKKQSTTSPSKERSSVASGISAPAGGAGSDTEGGSSLASAMKATAAVAVATATTVGVSSSTTFSENSPAAIRQKWGHLAQLTEFALALRDTLNNINKESFNNFVLRMGINQGPITAGVIGARKPHYDMWGNTVNVASRMESTGKAGCIQVVEETAHILEHFGYIFEQRGLVSVKGKGKLMTYYLVGKRQGGPIITTPAPAGSAANGSAQGASGSGVASTSAMGATSPSGATTPIDPLSDPMTSTTANTSSTIPQIISGTGDLSGGTQQQES